MWKDSHSSRHSLEPWLLAFNVMRRYGKTKSCAVAERMNLALGYVATLVKLDWLIFLHRRLFLISLFNDRNFMENTHIHNSILSFTLMRAIINYSIIDGHRPHTFHISGPNYHQIGSLMPPEVQDLHNFIFMTRNMSLAIESMLLGGEAI